MVSSAAAIGNAESRAQSLSILTYMSGSEMTVGRSPGSPILRELHGPFVGEEGSEEAEGSGTHEEDMAHRINRLGFMGAHRVWGDGRGLT